MAVDRKIISQLGTNLQLARSGMVSYSGFHPIRPSAPRFHVSLFSLISSSSGRHRVECKWYSNPEVLINPTFGTMYGASAIPIRHCSRTTQLLLGLPASSEIRAMSTQLEDSAQPIFDAAGIGCFPTSDAPYCPAVCGVVPSSTRAAIGASSSVWPSGFRSVVCRWVLNHSAVTL
ncbi:hypothetical protein B0H14DRAFT_3137713 [Mycena olivaceomarginata]|nr:hypothetical protein B0H14DRAFT_3137713 [Mycena olivaceomarginata]